MRFRLEITQRNDYSQTVSAEFDNLTDACIFAQSVLHNFKNTKVVIESIEEKEVEE